MLSKLLLKCSVGALAPITVTTAPCTLKLLSRDSCLNGDHCYSILPTSRDAETAVTLYIQHNRKLEGHNLWMQVSAWLQMLVNAVLIQSSSDLKGPCLTKLHGTDEGAIYGMQNIKAHLEEVHRVVRKGEQTKVYDTCK